MIAGWPICWCHNLSTYGVCVCVCVCVITAYNPLWTVIIVQLATSSSDNPDAYLSPGLQVCSWRGRLWRWRAAVPSAGSAQSAGAACPRSSPLLHRSCSTDPEGRHTAPAARRAPSQRKWKRRREEHDAATEIRWVESEWETIGKGRNMWVTVRRRQVHRSTPARFIDQLWTDIFFKLLYSLCNNITNVILFVEQFSKNSTF